MIRKVTIATAIACLSIAYPCLAGDRSGVFGIEGRRGSHFEIMSPDNGLRLDIGSKHAIALLKTKNNACELALVVAEAAQSDKAPGAARIVVAVLPGDGLRLDSADGSTAEFTCSQGGERMNARVFDRRPYRS